MSEVVSLAIVTAAPERAAPSRDVFFDRREFRQILDLYGKMVAQGEWRDYALSHDRDSCSFAVFKRASEGPLFQITKTPALARRQGAFAVVGASGRVLKRGQALDQVLKLFDRRRVALV